MPENARSPILKLCLLHKIPFRSPKCCSGCEKTSPPHRKRTIEVSLRLSSVEPSQVIAIIIPDFRLFGNGNRIAPRNWPLPSKQKKTPQPVSQLRVFMLALPIFPGRRQPSIVGAGELNFCVRYGNRWTLTAISTNLFNFSKIESRSQARLLYHTFKPLSTGDPYRI